MVLALIAGAALATACDPVEDAEPTVATVNFEPRLRVAVDDDGISAEPGARDGAEELSGDEGDWRVPSGSVIDLVNDATDDRRVVVTVSPLGAPDAEPTPWVDSGAMEPGESTVLGLSAAGVYRFDDLERGGADSVELVVQVVPRSAP